jgi:hypothetical protein
MALLKLEDIKKLLDDNKIDLKDLKKLSALEEIKKKNAKILGLLNKFEELVNSKKVPATDVDKMLDDITKILNDKLPKRKPKSKTSAPKKEEKVENVENLNENENVENV